jgi:hypothetical protein
VAEVMRSCRAAAPSIAAPGASDDTIQLSTTEPMVEPMKPPMAAPDAEDRAAEGTADGGTDGAENERGHVGNLSVREQEGEGDAPRQDGVSGSSITPSRS